MAEGEIAADIARGEDVSPRPRLPRPTASAAAKLAAGAALLGLVLAQAGWMLLDARHAARRAAEQAVQNLALGAERDLGRTIEGYDLSLQNTARALSFPGLDALAPEQKRLVLFDGATDAAHVGGVAVFDAGGRPVHDSRAPVDRAVSVADRDYFRVHRARPDVGLFVGAPSVDRIEGGRSIPLSRRLAAPDGSFAGVVSGAIRLDHVQSLFGALDLGERGSMSLFTADGRLVAHRPHDERDVGRGVGGAPVFGRFARAPDGTFAAAGPLDGVRRLYAHRRVGASSLILSVGLSEREVYAPWTRMALAVGAALLSALALASGLALWLRRAQAQLRRLNEGLEGRVREEVAAREAVQVRTAHAERMQALGQLAGGIAHDLNNVLQAVQGAAELIERRPGDAAGVRRLARAALDAAGRGVAVTGRLLAFSRRDVLRAEPVDAAALLAGAREMLAHALGAGVEVRMQTAPGLPPLLADKGQLETVLVNLAANARDAMPGGGTLTLAAALDAAPGAGGPDGGPGGPPGLGAGRHVRLTVADTGSGMAPEVLARVAEPFFTTKPMGKGTALVVRVGCLLAFRTDRAEAACP